MAKKGPTIMQIVPHFDTGGMELNTLELCEAIPFAGGFPVVLTGGGRLVPHLKQMGIDVLMMQVGSKNPVVMLKNAFGLSKIIKNYGIDLLHANSRAPAWSALWAARITGCPFVTTYHGAYAEKNWIKSFYNGVMARGDLVVAVSSYIKDLIITRYGLNASKIRIIHGGIDTKKFDPLKISALQIDELRKAWKISPNDRIILHPARLTSWKGQEILLDAIHILKQKGLPQNVKVVMAGDDQGRNHYKNYLQQRINNLGLEDVVRLVGHVDNISIAYKAADISVIASTLPEAFGRTAIEAQAMECPVIATRLGATTETVRSSPEYPSEMRTGWLVPHKDPRALSNALWEALNLTPSARSEIGKRGREYISSNFSLSQMHIKNLHVYDELLGTNLVQKYETSQQKING